MQDELLAEHHALALALLDALLLQLLAGVHLAGGLGLAGAHLDNDRGDILNIRVAR